jgi:hypothetical protein
MLGGVLEQAIDFLVICHSSLRVDLVEASIRSIAEHDLLLDQ